MTTRDKYTDVPEPYSWDVSSGGAARFTWEYDDGRDRLLALYQKGKDKQWDAQSASTGRWRSTRRPARAPRRVHPLYGTPLWDAA